VEPPLAFNSDPIPDRDVHHVPALPLKLLYVAFVVSPLVVALVIENPPRQLG
jgi:hypothetical protein